MTPSPCARRVIVSLCALSLLGGVALANNPPVASNVTASQRQDGSKVVDIYYRPVDADGDDCTITLQASSDGGATWNVPITAVSGHEGPGVLPGVNRHIEWGCVVDLPGAFGSRYRGRVQAAPRSPVICAGHTDRVNSVAFSPDGSTRVKGSHDRAARIVTLRPSAGF